MQTKCQCGSSTTLILTVLNEEVGLEEFLFSISNQSCYPSELIIVDAGSSDKTIDIIEAWAVRQAFKVDLSIVPKISIAGGRNLAVANSETTYIAITDAGTILDEKWIHNIHLPLMTNNETDVISGFYFPTGKTWKQKLIVATITHHISEISAEKFLPSSRSLLLRRSAFELAEGYPEWLDYCEDLVLDLKLRKLGCSFVFAPEALVSWDGRATLAGYAKQYFRYARGDRRAGLWKARHALRFSTYLSGLGVMLLPVPNFAFTLWVIGYGAYSYKFVKRIFLHRKLIGKTFIFAIFACIPIVIIGDSAKMAGYLSSRRIQFPRDK